MYTEQELLESIAHVTHIFSGMELDKAARRTMKHEVIPHLCKMIKALEGIGLTLMCLIENKQSIIVTGTPTQSELCQALYEMLKIKQQAGNQSNKGLN